MPNTVSEYSTEGPQSVCGNLTSGNFSHDNVAPTASAGVRLGAQPMPAAKIREGHLAARSRLLRACCLVSARSKSPTTRMALCLLRYQRPTIVLVQVWSVTNVPCVREAKFRETENRGRTHFVTHARKGQW